MAEFKGQVFDHQGDGAQVQGDVLGQGVTTLLVWWPHKAGVPSGEEENVTLWENGGRYENTEFTQLAIKALANLEMENYRGVADVTSEINNPGVYQPMTMWRKWPRVTSPELIRTGSTC